MPSPYQPPDSQRSVPDSSGNSTWQGHRFVVTGDYFPAYFPLLGRLFVQVDDDPPVTSTKLRMKEKFEVPFTHEGRTTHVQFDAGYPNKTVAYSLTIEGKKIAEGRITLRRWFPAIIINFVVIFGPLVAGILFLRSLYY